MTETASDYLTADDHEELEKLRAHYGRMVPRLTRTDYHAMKVLEALFAFKQRYLSELRLTTKALADAAMLGESHTTVAVQRLADLGIITVGRRTKAGSAFKINPPPEAKS
jgi:hypothetical protein